MKSFSSFSMKKQLASRRIIFIICICAVLLIGGYIWWSVSFWNNYNDRFAAAEAESRAKLQSALGMKTDDKDQRVAKLTALSEAVSALPSNESLCDTIGLIGWQRILGDLKTRTETCNKRQGRLVELRHSLSKVVEYLQAEHALAQILAAAPAGGELAEGAWTQQRDAWAALSKNVENSKSTKEFDSVKEATKGAVNALVAVWNEVLAAHQAKDKNRYMKASTALLGAYEGLKSVSKHDTDKLQSLLADVEQLYALLSRV